MVERRKDGQVPTRDQRRGYLYAAASAKRMAAGVQRSTVRLLFTTLARARRSVLFLFSEKEWASDKKNDVVGSARGKARNCETTKLRAQSLDGDGDGEPY